MCVRSSRRSLACVCVVGVTARLLCGWCAWRARPVRGRWSLGARPCVVLCVAWVRLRSLRLVRHCCQAVAFLRIVASRLAWFADGGGTVVRSVAFPSREVALRCRWSGFSSAALSWRAHQDVCLSVLGRSPGMRDLSTCSCRFSGYRSELSRGSNPSRGHFGQWAAAGTEEAQRPVRRRHMQVARGDCWTMGIHSPRGSGARERARGRAWLACGLRGGHAVATLERARVTMVVVRG